MGDGNGLFYISDTEIEKHRIKQTEKNVKNKKLRDRDVSFFSAMGSEDANYIKKGILVKEDLLNACESEGE